MRRRRIIIIINNKITYHYKITISVFGGPTSMIQDSFNILLIWALGVSEVPNVEPKMPSSLTSLDNPPDPQGPQIPPQSAPHNTKHTHTPPPEGVTYYTITWR